MKIVKIVLLIEQEQRRCFLFSSIVLIAVHNKDICFIFIQLFHDILVYFSSCLCTSVCNYLCSILILINCI